MNDKKKNRSSSSSQRVSSELNVVGFVWRFIATLLLVLATYNPSGTSYVHWVRSAMEAGTLGPEHFVVGVLVVIGWVILLAATHRSLGPLGLLLGGALFGGLVWLLIDLGWISVDSTAELTWIILVVLSAVLAIGLSWSHIWRRLTGQFEVDDDG